MSVASSQKHGICSQTAIQLLRHPKRLLRSDLSPLILLRYGDCGDGGDRRHGSPRYARRVHGVSNMCAEKTSRHPALLKTIAIQSKRKIFNLVSRDNTIPTSRIKYLAIDSWSTRCMSSGGEGHYRVSALPDQCSSDFVKGGR